tara:strand:+ start:69 stop:362 length:294 start_codon:yes stop_codon:yes gene_type:complete
MILPCFVTNFTLNFKVIALLQKGLQGGDYTENDFIYLKKSLVMRFFNIGTQNFLRHSSETNQKMLRDDMKKAVGSETPNTKNREIKGFNITKNKKCK